MWGLAACQTNLSPSWFSLGVHIVGKKQEQSTIVWDSFTNVDLKRRHLLSLPAPVSKGLRFLPKGAGPQACFRSTEGVSRHMQRGWEQMLWTAAGGDGLCQGFPETQKVRGEYFYKCERSAS